MENKDVGFTTFLFAIFPTSLLYHLQVSPKEAELLETAVRLSGLTKQDYIIRRLQEKEVVVTGNPRVYKALKNELAKVLNELKRLKKGDDVPEDLLEVIRLITVTMDGMKEE